MRTYSSINYRPSDVLLMLSASGNFSNVLQAAEWVQAQGGQATGLLGLDSGKLKSMRNATSHTC